MAFDQTTRNRLQRFVNDARRVLEEEFTRQLQNDYGMDPHAARLVDEALEAVSGCLVEGHLLLASIADREGHLDL